MGLKIGEAFKDSIYVYDTVTGAPEIGIVATCVVIDQAGNRNHPAGGAVVEEGLGWYSCTWTPDAAGTWKTEWGSPAGTSIGYPFKLFHVGAGQEADLEILHDVPLKDAATNAHIRDVLGNKTDTPKWLFSDTQSAMALLKAATHTGGGISYAGQCDAGMAASTTIIVCNQLAGFGDDFFNTDYVMKVALNDNNHGASPEADAARDITDYDTATGTFTTTAFNNNVEANDKIIVSKRSFYNLDQIPILTTPGLNSFAYRVSQYLADGDGDFGAGTALPSNTSLYDILVRHVVTRTWFSVPQETVDLHAVAANESLPSVILPNITGNIVSAYAGIMFCMKEATAAGVIGVDGAQHIQVKESALGAYTDAISIVDHMFSIADSTREGGTAVIGDHDIVGQVAAFNKTYNFQWTSGKTHVDHLRFSTVQTFLIVSYY